MENVLLQTDMLLRLLLLLTEMNKYARFIKQICTLVPSAHVVHMEVNCGQQR